MKTCTVQHLQALLQNDPSLFLVDCRRPEEFEEGHVPGAQLISLGDNLESYTWPKDHSVYVICRSGSRSAAFCQELKSLGVEAVNVEGGMKAWIQEAYALE